jgi:hypothetical protein
MDYDKTFFLLINYLFIIVTLKELQYFACIIRNFCTIVKKKYIYGNFIYYFNNYKIIKITRFIVQN